MFELRGRVIRSESYKHLGEESLREGKQAELGNHGHLLGTEKKRLKVRCLVHSE